MGKWKEYNPDTGAVEINAADEETGNVIVHKMQDVQPLLDRQKELANTGATDIGIKKGLWCYCSIPIAIQYEMLTKHGLNVQNKHHWAQVIALVNTDYPHLKTTHKWHRVKGEGRKHYGALKNSQKQASSTKPGGSLTTTSPTSTPTIVLP